MSGPLISVVLCTYNGERFLAAQLDSLLLQDYPDLEIVAVDDGSTDRTLEILNAYRDRDPRLKIFQNAVNLGFSKNFERAITLSSGNLIAPCDQDDIWLPNKLSALAAKRGSADLIYCNSELMDQHDHPLGLEASDKLNMYRGSDPRVFLFSNCVSGHALLCTRELAVRAMPFPPGGFHDWWLALVAAATGSVEYLDECLVRYRQHSSAQTDLSGSRNRNLPKPRGHGLREIEKRTRWLASIRDIPGNRQREFFMELCALWEDWKRSYCAPSMSWFMYRHRRAIFHIPKSPETQKLLRPLNYLVGLRLKQVLKPAKYR